MSQIFEKAIKEVILHEGGYNNHVEDKGGATNWGISLRFLQSINKDIDGDGDIDYTDIKNLTYDQAKKLYYDNFWKPIYDKLPEKVAIKLFDTAVNMGTIKSNKIFQRTINIFAINSIKEDGLIGSKTLDALNNIYKMGYKESILLKGFCDEQNRFYTNIIKNDPSQVKFKNGWYNRAYWLPK